MNKIIAALFVIFIAITSCFCNMKTYAASSIPVNSITVDYTGHQLIITDKDNTIYYLGIEGRGGNAPKKYNSYMTQGDTTVIDLSTFSVKRVWVLLLHGDKDTVNQKIIINANLKKLKANYDPFALSIGEMVKIFFENTMIELNNIEWKTINGSWRPGSELNLNYMDSFTVYGTTLYFREKAAEPAASPSANGATIGRPSSAEVKLKIPVRRDPPKISINYKKMTISFPGNVEYRLTHDGAWRDISGTVLIASLYEGTHLITSEDLYIEVRTKSTAKSIESKLNIITIPMQKSVASTVTDNITIVNTTKENKGTTKMELKNGSGVDIEYFISDTPNPVIDFVKQKWSLLKKGKSASLNKKKANMKYIIYRIPYEKKVSLPSTTASTTQIIWTEAVR